MNAREIAAAQLGGSLEIVLKGEMQTYATDRFGVAFIKLCDIANQHGGAVTRSVARVGHSWIDVFAGPYWFRLYYVDFVLTLIERGEPHGAQYVNAVWPRQCVIWSRAHLGVRHGLVEYAPRLNLPRYRRVRLAVIHERQFIHAGKSV